MGTDFTSDFVYMYDLARYVLQGHVSEKTDAFSYGVLLIELLTNEPPAAAR